jgi:hypothetical protein
MQQHYDLAQSTAFQTLAPDKVMVMTNLFWFFILFNPSSTTYVKHFIANCNDYDNSDYSFNSFISWLWQHYFSS